MEHCTDIVTIAAGAAAGIVSGAGLLHYLRQTGDSTTINHLNGTPLRVAVAGTTTIDMEVAQDTPEHEVTNEVVTNEVVTTEVVTHEAVTHEVDGGGAQPTRDAGELNQTTETQEVPVGHKLVAPEGRVEEVGESATIANLKNLLKSALERERDLRSTLAQTAARERHATAACRATDKHLREAMAHAIKNERQDARTMRQVRRREARKHERTCAALAESERRKLIHLRSWYAKRESQLLRQLDAKDEQLHNVTEAIKTWYADQQAEQKPVHASDTLEALVCELEGSEVEITEEEKTK
jgi:hypothetical protein